MRKILLLLLLLPLVSMGQSLETTPTEELRVIKRLFYDRGSYIASDEERAVLHDLIVEMRADSTLRVHITGHCDKWGGVAFNDKFSYLRAMGIADWMFSRRVPREQITFAGCGIDTSADNDVVARRVEISRVFTVEAEAVSETLTGTLAETVSETVSETEAEPQPQPIEKEIVRVKERRTTDISLRTNMLYWLGGLMNIGIEWRPNNTQMGIVINGGYSPFGDTDWSHNMGGWFVSPELRYYIPSNERWFVGAEFLAGGYNFKLSDTGRQGTVLGGGVMGGYKTELSRCFDIDFTLGVGYTHFNYDTYFRCEPNDINPYINKDVTKGTIFPIQLGVNLIWKTYKR